MENIKKISIYNLNVKYFNDSNNDGIGDLKGLLKKIDYFTFLNIDALILNDILSSESNEKNQNFTSISNQVGTIDDFEKIIKKCKKIGIKIFIEMNLGSIKKQHK
jgi:glycosidase